MYVSALTCHGRNVEVRGQPWVCILTLFETVSCCFFFLLCIPGQLAHELLRFLLCLPPISLKGHEDFKCVPWVLYGLWDYTHIFYFCVANISHTEPFPQL